MSRKVKLGFHHFHREEPTTFEILPNVNVTLFDQSKKLSVERMIGILGPNVPFKVVSVEQTNGVYRQIENDLQAATA